jgi:hypothetical protein
MSDRAQTNNPNPEASTFFTVEVVHGASPELNNLACTMVRLAIESSIAVTRVQLLNRKNAPQIFLRYDGTIHPEKKIQPETKVHP